MTVNLIAAIGKSGQIGLDGALPWPRQEEDLYWFRRMTEHGLLIMGHRTLDTLGWSPGRFSGDRIVSVPSPRIPHYSPETHLKHLDHEYPGREIWIAGGAATYRLFAPFVERLHIARIDYDGPADTWFPFDAYGLAS